VIPIASASAVVRSAGAVLTASVAVRAVAEVAAASSARLDGERRVGRSPVDPLPQLLEPDLGARPGDRDVGRAGDRQAEELGQPPARQLPARALVLEPDRRGERYPSLRGGGREVGRRHNGGVEHDRERDRLPALEPRQGAHDPSGCDVPREPPARLPRHDLDLEALPDELRLDVALVDRAREPVQLEVERRVVHADRRHDLGAEEARLQPLEPAHRPEPLSLARRGVDRRGPVGLHPQRRRLDRELAAADGEDDGSALDALEPAHEHGPGFLPGQTADVDAGDLDAVGDPDRGACESKADQRRKDGDQGEGHQDPARDQARGVIGYPGADRWRVYPHEPVSVAIAPARAGCELVKIRPLSGAGTG
jgi:hypothetical protein